MSAHVSFPHTPGDSELTLLVEFARQCVEGRRASLMLPIEDGSALSIVAGSGLPQGALDGIAVPMTEGVAGLVARTGQPLLVNGDHPLLGGPGSRRYKTASFISVPVPLDRREWGVLSVADPLVGERFHKRHLAMLQAIAPLAGAVLGGIIARTRQQELQATIAQLLKQLVEAQEHERSRIARDLHDEAGHALTTAIFHIDLEDRKLAAEDVATRRALSQARGTLVEVANALHSIAFMLRPRILTDLGLVPALHSLIAQIEELGPRPVHLAIIGRPPRLSLAIEWSVFRIVQEGLTNIRKHAAAAQAWVTLTFRATDLSLIIEDDGIGIDVEALANPQHLALGLSGMRERVELLAGTIAITRREGGGTVIAVALPLHTREEEDDAEQIGMDPRSAD